MEQQNNLIKKEQDFFIGRALQTIPDNFIQDRKIPCESAQGDKFACTTFHSLDVENKKDKTESIEFRPFGLEINPEKNTVRHFAWIDIGSFTTNGVKKFTDQIEEVKFNKNECYKKVATGDKMMYVFNENYKHNCAIDVINSKIKNRLKKLEKESFKDKNKSLNSSFDKENYEFSKYQGDTTIKPKWGQTFDYFMRKTKKKKKTIQRYNEMNFLKKDQEGGKLLCDRIFVYEEDLINNKVNKKISENVKIHDIQKKCFPGETIRVINKETQKYNLMSTEDFYNMYCK